MTVKELLDEGRLDAAIAQTTAAVKAQPANLTARTTLFELLCFSGELDRARRQLDAIGHLDTDPKTALGLKAYSNLLACEEKRSRLFAEGRRPRFMAEPPAEIDMHLRAIDLFRQGQFTEARAFLDQAFERAPDLSGTFDGTPFQGIRDADDLLGPVLEVFAADDYCWVPWAQIQFLEIAPPANLRDLLWVPGRIASFDGAIGEVYLPTIYLGSAASPDDAIRLGLRTDWQDSGGIVRGTGRKTLLIGDEARTLLELRELRLATPAEQS